MIREILLVHHSHTDIGYTHPQPVIFELHRRFIDLTLDYCEADPDFRWTCEVTGITLDWWRTATQGSRDRFLAAVNRGQVEVAGMMWNITPLADHRMLLKLLEPIRIFRGLGIPVRSAMNSDVNGVPWGIVDALLDHGIDGFSMGVNEHYGYAVQPRPGSFWWESPTGRKLLVWNGLQYWNAANIHMRIPESVEAVAGAIPAYLKVWEDRGYPLSFLPVQVTTASAPDNAAPDPRIPEFVREWNASGQEIAIRLVNLSDVFDRLKGEELPTMSGDWTDWWNFGCGSTARETGLALEGMRLLDSAHSLSALPESPNAETGVMERAAGDLALYAEHTWGADRSVYKPDSIETYAQLNQKLGFAYRGYLEARIANRDALVAVAKEAGGDELTTLFYNPNSVPVSRMVKVPTEATGVRYLAEPRLHLAHRLDTTLADLPDPEEEGGQSKWVGPIELPAYGYRAVPYGELKASEAGLRAEGDQIGNDRIGVRFHEDGGVASLTLDGEEFVGESAWRFACPVLEEPVEGRGGIFGPLNWRDLNVHEQWHTDWEAKRSHGKVVARYTATIDGCAEHGQSIDMPNGDHVDVTYRVFRGEANVEVTVEMRKQPLCNAHALYLPLPLAADPGQMSTHFETAGAIVELDKEQLPYASKHYVTTMRFIRAQDEAKGLTVSCPDSPLWQVGGFTFGRIEAGEVERPEAMLNAWLTNNYWDVNFCADQGGTIRYRFRLLPHRAEPLERSIEKALAYANEPQIHVYQGFGGVRKTEGSLVRIEGGAIASGMRVGSGGVRFELMNPTDETLAVRIRSEAYGRLSTTDLYGENPVRIEGSEISLPPRAWIGVRLER
jgi:hypothetical protein